MKNEATKKLSHSERHLTTYIENNLDRIPEMSIVKLSEDANVSTATIVRTMKKMGYDGFTSFKHHLKEAEANNPRFAIVEQVDKEIKQAILKNEQEVTRTIQMLNSGTIEDAIQKIKSANRIYIFARGFSELIAKEMMVKFQLMNKYCEMHDDPNIIRPISRRLSKQDIVIFISLNSETLELVEAAENCAQDEITTITITANSHGPLAKLSDILFVGFKSPISYFPDYEVRSRLPLQVITRVLLDAYAVRNR
ncbi:MurR/RpiR family transcriptional regulator [Vagococcus sp. BWB3-3]|uniref:MurR/RpiR family transcriptional regulator n=1 Tax=Vagococcus allomyrinae TaxID=2794353 RepID=A0A940P6B6_9ENTE|nr:MurR/RpiR family transcriptional regulator [Vagococcus allomyrinae]MBP1042217.1 MurR/RpiR family transcriptional regulator [Vagococcus allomyrinae]